MQGVATPVSQSALKERMFGIDAFRLIAFLFIVILHSKGALRPSNTLDILDTVPRFAVPFFFVVSGYFLNIEDRTIFSVVFAFLKRLLPVFVFWNLVYLIFNRITTGGLGFRSPLGLITGASPGFHLWFLPSLGFSVVLVVILIKTISLRATIAICASLHVVSLYFVEFGATFFSAAEIWNFRNGPFLWSIFVALGYLAKRDVWRLGWWPSSALFVSGLACQLVERNLLLATKVISATTVIDCYATTILAGLGAFLMSMNAPGTRLVRAAAKIGKWTLGFYCIHILFIWLSRLFIDRYTVTGVLLIAVCASVLSITAVLIASKVRVLGRVLG
jgi:surface polysaccharide O-acyltransferase-like enzyme